MNLDVRDKHVALGDIAVGMAGTFDVKNYGDLLFPLIAAEALKRRDRRIRVMPFSPNGVLDSFWPLAVRPVEELSESLSMLSGMLIGGGQIVRFDKSYPIAVPANVDMPIAYWLVPAAMAAFAGKPVIWNAVGAWTESPRAPWHDELLRQVFAASYFIGVRDVASRDHLAKLAPNVPIELLPDTAFGLSRLWPLEKESDEFENWRASPGLDGNYVVIQANAAVGRHCSRIEALLQSLGAAKAIILPVCWCHGDRAEQFPQMQGRLYPIQEWPGPKLIAEIIGRSQFVFTSSLHACITALSYGVPCARVPIPSDRKFELLDAFEGIARIDDAEALARLVRRGRRIEPLVVECADRLDRYWDEVAEVLLKNPITHCNRSSSLMLDWIARTCADQGRLGFGRMLIATLRDRRRLHLTLRGWLDTRFPNRRSAFRRCLSFLKRVAVAAYRWTARSATSAIAPQASEAAHSSTQLGGLKRALSKARQDAY